MARNTNRNLPKETAMTLSHTNCATFCTACRVAKLHGKGSRADQDAAWGNDRVARAEFIREEMRQTGCLAIEAAARFADGSK